MLYLYFQNEQLEGEHFRNFPRAIQLGYDSDTMIFLSQMSPNPHQVNVKGTEKACLEEESLYLLPRRGTSCSSMGGSPDGEVIKEKETGKLLRHQKSRNRHCCKGKGRLENENVFALQRHKLCSTYSSGKGSMFPCIFGAASGLPSVCDYAPLKYSHYCPGTQ